MVKKHLEAGTMCSESPSRTYTAKIDNDQFEIKSVKSIKPDAICIAHEAKLPIYDGSRFSLGYTNEAGNLVEVRMIAGRVIHYTAKCNCKEAGCAQHEHVDIFGLLVLD